MAAPIVNIKFLADLTQFSTGMQNATRRLDTLGKKFEKVGRGFTLGLTAPLSLIGLSAVNAAADFEKLNVSLDTVFQGNEAAAKKAFNEINKFTAETPFQLEEVAGAFIKLKNLGLDPSIASLRSYGNTASALGKDLNQFVEAVADASVNEFERLKEFGIKAKQEGSKVAFTFQGVTTRINKNSDEIQEYLQNIGNVNFAGGIEKQAKTFLGRISTLRDNLKLISAEFGEIIIEFIEPFANGLQEAIKYFKELSPQTKKFIVIIGGVAAAIGPLLALAGTILPAIGSGLALLTGPIGLVAAGLTAIGVIIYKNWEPIKKTLVDIANYFVDLYNESILFRGGVELIVTSFKNIFDVGQFVFSSIGDLITLVAANIKNSFIGIGDLLKAVITGNFKAIPGILSDSFSKGLDNFKDFTKSVVKEFIVLKDDVSGNISQGITNALSDKKYTLDPVNINVKPLEEKVGNAVKAGLQQSASVGGAPSLSNVVGVNSLNPEDIKQVPSPLAQAADQISLQNALISEQQSIAVSNALQFNEAFSSVLQQGAQNVAAGFGEFIAGFAQGNLGLKDLAGLIVGTIADMAIQLGKAAIGIGVTLGAIKLGFDSLNPAVTIAAGVALVALGTLAKSAIANIGNGGETPFANGGIVYGPTRALIGEYAGARNNPEVVAPLDKLQSLLVNRGSDELEVTGGFTVSGDQLQLILDRTAKRKNRIG